MTPPLRTPPLSRTLLTGLIGGVIAAVINTVIYFTAQGLNGGPLLVTPPGATAPQPLALPILLFASVMPGLAGGALYWLLGRFTAQPERWLLMISAVVLVGFAFTPISGASGAVAVWTLELLHLSTAAPILWLLLRR